MGPRFTVSSDTCQEKIKFLSRGRHLIHLSLIYLQMVFMYNDQRTIKDNQADYKIISKNLQNSQI